MVKAFLIHTHTKKIKHHKTKRGKKSHIKSICFAHSSFQNERVKQGPLVKKREISFPPPPDSEYIPCEQMAEFPVLALWGNENAELLFAIILFWGLVCGGFFGGEWGTGKFGNDLFIIYPTIFQNTIFPALCTCKYQGGLFRVKDLCPTQIMTCQYPSLTRRAPH